MVKGGVEGGWPNLRVWKPRGAPAVVEIPPARAGAVSCRGCSLLCFAECKSLKLCPEGLLPLLLLLLYLCCISCVARLHVLASVSHRSTNPHQLPHHLPGWLVAGEGEVEDNF